jgi:hypothetical protein
MLHGVYPSNWRATGQTVQFPQYELTIRAIWEDANGNPHEQEETVLFPNCLAGEFTLAEQKEIAEDIMVAAIRRRFGVD